MLIWYYQPFKPKWLTSGPTSRQFEDPKRAFCQAQMVFQQEQAMQKQKSQGHLRRAKEIQKLRKLRNLENRMTVGNILKVRRYETRNPDIIAHVFPAQVFLPRLFFLREQFHTVISDIYPPMKYLVFFSHYNHTE